MSGKNKGEWSELYAFLKLLADAKIYGGGEHLQPQLDKYYPILKVFRTDNIDRIGYEINAGKRIILVAGKQESIEVPQDEFRRQASNLLDFIKQIKSSSQENLDIIPFLNSIKVDNVSAKSSDKADIRLVIHDLRTGTTPELGYSVKSKLGGNSTLINSNKNSTNFVYKISNFPESRIYEFNSCERFKQKFELLNSYNANIKYSDIASNNMLNNLLLLDCGMPQIIGECLLRYYSGQAKLTSDISNILLQDNPLNFCTNLQSKFYEYKLKQFLLAFALGMTPSTIWNGKFNANGGYIIVKEDGDIVCYHFFDRNELENYLFTNTYFDTPSTTRHEFGNIYKSDGNLFIKLNLLVRFIG